MSHDSEYQSAVISAYYARMVSQSDTIRGRAQGAYPIISTLAGGLIGVGLLANLSQLTPEVRILGLLATGAWVLAAAAFVNATLNSVKVPEREQYIDRNFVDYLIDLLLEEKRWVRRRLTGALMLSVLAAATTIATLVFAVMQYPPNSARGVVQLTPTGVDLLVAQCGTPRSNEAVVNIRGLLSTSNFLDVVVAEGPGQGCHVFLPRTSTLGLKLK